jgi:macrophage erythroblast attacher
MAASKIHPEGMLLFEQPFVKVRLMPLASNLPSHSRACQVPYENYRKVFRTSQRAVEKEFSAIQSLSQTIVGQSGQDAAASLDAMISKVDGLKRKVSIIIPLHHEAPFNLVDDQLSEVQDTAGSSTKSVMRERIQHIKFIDTLQSTDGAQFSGWAECRLDRWLVDWSLRRGKEKTARRIAAEKGIEVRTLVFLASVALMPPKGLVDIELFMDIRRIEDDLRNQSCIEALAWCSENKAALRKAKAGCFTRHP